MNPTASQIEEIQKLESTAEELLGQIAASAQPPSPDTLRHLEHIAAAVAKIAFGTGNPTLISAQMRSLIAWTDHLNDPSWTARFQQALMTRPLIAP